MERQDYVWHVASLYSVDINVNRKFGSFPHGCSVSHCSNVQELEFINRAWSRWTMVIQSSPLQSFTNLVLIKIIFPLIQTFHLRRGSFYLICQRINTFSVIILWMRHRKKEIVQDLKFHIYLYGKTFSKGHFSIGVFSLSLMTDNVRTDRRKLNNSNHLFNICKIICHLYTILPFT